MGLYLLALVSFLQAVRIPTPLPKGLVPPRQKPQLKHNHPLYTHSVVCEKENNHYKPPRTCHCRHDGCVARFVSLG